MKLSRFSVLATFAVSPTFLFAQIAGINSLPTSSTQSEQMVSVLTGRLMADGSPLQASGNVLLECNNQVRAQNYTDNKGNFSLTVYVTDQAVPMSVTQPRAMLSSGEWFGCELYGDVAGYRSERLPLRSQPENGTVNVGNIELHAVSGGTGSASDPRFVVSVSSLAAPDKARKAFNKGQQEARKGRLQAACDYFKQALATYPRYAVAWLELGRVQARQNSFVDAQQSFRQAVTDDSKLSDGYVELARVAAQQQNWKAVADATNALVQRWPESSAEYWFMNSAANYNLGDIKAAETSITRGFRLDPRHQFSQMEYLYGLILGNKKDYKSAVEHISTYLRLNPNASDASEARQMLEAYQQRAETADAEQH